MKYMFILLLLLNSCVTEKSNVSNRKLNFEFDKNMTYDEFKIRLENYSKNYPYPNIND